MNIKNLFRQKYANDWLAFCGNILLVMGMLSICRILFLALNQSLFPDTSSAQFIQLFLGGLRFDFSAFMMVNIVYIALYFLSLQWRYKPTIQNILKWWFVVTNSIMFMVNCVDIVYFRFTLRRTTANVVSEFGSDTKLASLLVDMVVDYWLITLIWIILTVLLAKLYIKTRGISPLVGIKAYILFYTKNTIGFALVATIALFGVRGDFRPNSRPITLSNAGDYVKRPLEVGIVQNSLFTIVKTIGKQTPTRVHYFENLAALEQAYNPIHRPQPTAPFNNMNVVIIIWESMAKEYVGGLNTDLDNGQYKGYTPFIDSLLPYSASFAYSYSNGRKSIDALPSVLTSIPFVLEPYVLSPFSGNFVNSIGSLLRTKGYHTSFFHGAHRGSMGFGAFVNTVGFEYYYGEEDYQKTTTGNNGGGWGAWDEEFLQYMVSVLNDSPQPFCSSVFTLSSHHPFILPKRYDGVFAEGPHALYRCIRYTDYALKRFFDEASKQPWFQNTLFVITADHSNHPYYPKYQNSIGQMSVPIIFYTPNQSIKHRIYQHVAQQTDIMPTILGRLNYDQPFVAFGQDALDTTRQHIAINYIGNTYQVFYNQYAMLYNPTNQQAQLFDLDNDPLLQHDISGTQLELVSMLEAHLKGFIQQYYNRMIDNCLTIECDKQP